MGSDDASTSGSGPAVQHMPRRRAVPPGLADVTAQINREAEMTAPPDAERVARAKEAALAALPPHIADTLARSPRIGPYIVQYGVWYGGIGVIAATYVRGFYGLAKKDRVAWANSFKYRVWILGPMIAAYCTAHGILPMPFGDRIERAVGRPAVTLAHILASDELKKQKAAEEAARRSAADGW